jgi:hypothetical protein
MGYDGADAGAPAEVQTSVVCRLQGACREHVLMWIVAADWCQVEPSCGSASCLTNNCDCLRDLLVTLTYHLLRIGGH